MSENAFSVTISELAEEFNLKLLNDADTSEVKVSSRDINRPGLAINGIYDHFEKDRIQLMGNAEIAFLEEKTAAERAEICEKLVATGVPAIIVTADLSGVPELKNSCDAHKTPLLKSESTTTQLMAALITRLNVLLAPRITRHGVLVEVYGEGILILGESGVGKSEAAVELVKRGHRLVADDAVEIKRVSDKTLVGSSPAIIRHFIELRGIGIVDVRRIFGMGAIKETEKIDLVINLEIWNDKKYYDRLGLVTEYTNILGLDVPCLNIPVRPGRNLAVVIEVAAMNNRQKKLGYNPAEELNRRLQQQMIEEGAK